MKKVALAAAGFSLLGLCVSARSQSQPARSTQPDAAGTGLVKEYCTGCHSDRGKAGGLSLAGFDVNDAVERAPVVEKMIRKLRAGMMPPPGVRRPDAAAVRALVESLETRVDRAAAAAPRPGWRPFQRLNRAEYARAVKDLVALDVDTEALLPPDTISQSFDNIADVQAFSPTLMEGYLRAASRVAALAVGDPQAAATEAHYRVPKTTSQLGRVDGAPLGTRGGISVVHTFPADGEYVFRMDLHGNADGFLFGGPAAGEQLELSVDGARKALLDVDPNMAEVTTSLTLRTPPVNVTAGPHRVTGAFIQRFEGPVNDLIAPIDHTLADTQIGVAYGVTTLPHLKDLSIVGPQRVTGVSETPSRRAIFTCRPTSPDDERPCASTIVAALAARAFRRPLEPRERERLMTFYDDGRTAGDFEAGITAAIEAILASPQFVFRLETSKSDRLGDLELASRLSFFLWARAPDAGLLQLARDGRLRAPGMVEKQTKRMLADPRAESLATRFAAQWLRLSDVDRMLPDALLYPYYDHSLGEAFVRETELFFDSLVRRDASVLELITADYTFVNERIARHYGIPNVSGNAFRQVTVPDYRRGLLGHGSVLVLTSVADRTSPVMRGKWVMEVLLGSPPPPPPPNVPALDETGATAAGRMLSTRERMEEHRRNPACASCHRVIDPIGLALENFDPTGKWRIKDNEVPVDSAGVLYDGTKIDGPAALRSALLQHQDVFLQTFAENLMKYALGRRVEYYDMPAVRAIVRAASQHEHRFSSFVLAIVDSNAFRLRGDGPQPSDHAAP